MHHQLPATDDFATENADLPYLHDLLQEQLCQNSNGILRENETHGTAKEKEAGIQNSKKY